MEKEFVPFELAVKMKEMQAEYGYSFGFYYEDGRLNVATGEMTIKQMHPMIIAPLWQQAFEWFREKHNVDAWVQPFVMKNPDNKRKKYLPDETYSYFVFRDGSWVIDVVDFLEPKDAQTACLEKLIEIVSA